MYHSQFNRLSTDPDSPVPWHLISEMFANGVPIDKLAAKFNLPAKSIQRRLDIALSASGYVRSNAEINHASNKVKSDLISTLVKMSSDLAKANLKSDKNALLKLERLTNIAARLFSWPSAKSVDVSSSQFIALPQNKAINLDLIRQKPESLEQIVSPQNE